MENQDATKKRLTVPQVKDVLEAIGEGNLDQFQRRTLDYVKKFSKIDAKVAEKLLGKLMKDFDLEEAEAVQVVNCMPETVDELRVFLASGRKIIETAKLEAIIALLDDNRVVK
ncbi:RNA polymerase Rpb4 [Candidatus Bathyarchaeota archaeon]|jgi:DNA-directed RNA polymerase subunit F|nr:RNA polymerase Rpb4 [Candidatus Bathyarchaeota archaeon]